MIRIVIVVALKILLPLAIPWFPFAAGWANFLLDSFDGDILVPAGLPEPTYQLLDKATDWLTYVMIVVWGWRLPIRREVLATFVLRSVGQAAFFVTRNELALFYFPNLLEPLFLIYASIARMRGAERVQTIYRRHLVAIWAFILLYKLQDEWVTHVGNVDRSELLGRLLGR